MKIYYIAVSSWDGRAYTFDYNEFFFSEQEMDAAYEKLRHNADFDVCKGEEGIILPEVFDTIAFQKGVEEGKRLMMEGATYNELMELYRAIRDELVKRHRDVPVNIKEKTMDLKEDTGNESALHQIRG